MVAGVVACVLFGTVQKAHAGYPWFKDGIDWALLNSSYEGDAENSINSFDTDWTQLFLPAENSVIGSNTNENSPDRLIISQATMYILNSPTLFSDSALPALSIPFDPASVFGSWLKTPGGTVFFSAMAQNPIRAHQSRAFHGSLNIGSPDRYSIRVRDLLGWKSPREYSDLIFNISRVSVNPVPHPSPRVLF